MSDTTATPMPAKRARLVLAKPSANTLEGSTLVQAKRSPQVHVLPAGASRTLCNIDTAKWSESTTVKDGKITCPVCAKGLAAAKKAAKAEPAEAVPESDAGVS